MEEFSNTRGEVSIIPKQLGQGHDLRPLFPQNDFVGKNSQFIRSFASQEGGPAGIADRVLTKGIVEFNPFARQAIDIRGMQSLGFIAPQFGPQVIDNDQ